MIGEASLFSLDVTSKTIGAISGTFGCTAGISGGLSMSLRAADAFIILPLRVDCGMFSMINYQPKAHPPQDTRENGVNQLCKLSLQTSPSFPGSHVAALTVVPKLALHAGEGSIAASGGD